MAKAGGTAYRTEGRCHLAVACIDTSFSAQYDFATDKTMLPLWLCPAWRTRRSQLRRTLLAFAAVVLLASTSPVRQADPTRYLNDIKSLAAPNMEGRGAGTQGLTRAEHLIEKRYQELKLDPAGVHEYAQPFSVITGAVLKGDNSLTVLSGKARHHSKANDDFVPFSFSSSGQVTAPVVFAGYGATADEFHYDDYAGLDVKGKIVVLLRYEPSSFAEKSGNHGLTQHSQLITKAINARNHGAQAVVLVNGKLGEGEEDLLTRFGSVSGPGCRHRFRSGQELGRRFAGFNPRTNL